MKKFLRRFSVVAGLSFALIAAGCGADDSTGTNGGNDNNNSNGGQEEAPSVSVGEQLDYTITGIDPGAGIMSAAETAIEEYNLEGFNLQASSDAAMTAALAVAYENEEPIVITGWTPHWKFAEFDLKYLEDPKQIFGDAEQVHTMARLGLDEDHPSAYEVLNNFFWEQEDIGDMMIAINEGGNPEQVAADWVAANQDKVSSWTDGVATVDGDRLTLVYVQWDCATASTHMIAEVLKGIGYNVELIAIQANSMWQAIAEGSADAMVTAWLPATHKHLYEDFQDNVEDLGVNLEGAGIGLVVPAYMDINSIEDLNN